MNIEDEDLELRQVQRLEGHTDKVLHLAWRPYFGDDDFPTLIASCGEDKTVRIWEQSPLTVSFKCKAVLEGVHIGTVRSCSWSPNGEFLATASFDAATALWKLDAENKFVCVSTFEDSEIEVESVAWETYGTFIATCGRDKLVYLWVTGADYEYISHKALEGHTKDVNLVQWHPYNKTLFSCSFDNTMKVWSDCESDDWPCIQTMDQSSSGHASTIRAISFNAAGNKMVSCSDDKTIKIWGSDIDEEISGHFIDQWVNLCTLTHEQPIFSVHWSWDGIISIGAGDNAICLFVEHKNGKVEIKNAHDKKVNKVEWNPSHDIHMKKENRHLASASDDGTIKIWELGVASAPQNLPS